MKKGQVLGKIQAVMGGEVVAEADLVATDDVPRAAILSLLRRHMAMLIRSLFSLAEPRNVNGG